MKKNGEIPKPYKDADLWHGRRASSRDAKPLKTPEKVATSAKSQQDLTSKFLEKLFV